MNMKICVVKYFHYQMGHEGDCLSFVDSSNFVEVTEQQLADLRMHISNLNYKASSGGCRDEYYRLEIIQLVDKIDVQKMVEESSVIGEESRRLKAEQSAKRKASAERKKAKAEALKKKQDRELYEQLKQQFEV